MSFQQWLKYNIRTNTNNDREMSSDKLIMENIKTEHNNKQHVFE
jgi:hypothetical protein